MYPTLIVTKLMQAYATCKHMPLSAVNYMLYHTNDNSKLIYVLFQLCVAKIILLMCLNRDTSKQMSNITAYIQP
jgi:hypothetical protein